METTLTRRQYLEKKYKEFTTELSDKLLCEGIFPSLDECCMVDILLYFQFTFCNTDTEDYEEQIRLILKHHIDITEEKFQEIYPTIKNYIDDLKKFLQSQN